MSNNYFELLSEYNRLMHEYRWLVSLYISSGFWTAWDRNKDSKHKYNRQLALFSRASAVIKMDRVQCKVNPLTGEPGDILTD